jgi:hypothetical protein
MEMIDSTVGLMELARKASITPDEITTCIRDGNFFTVRMIISRHLELNGEQREMLIHHENEQIRKATILHFGHDTAVMKIAVQDSNLEVAISAALSSGCSDEDRDIIWNRIKEEEAWELRSTMSGHPLFRADKHLDDFYKALEKSEVTLDGGITKLNSDAILTIGFLNNKFLPAEAVVRAAKAKAYCSRNARLHPKLPIAVVSELIFDGVPEARAMFRTRKEDLIQFFIQEGIIDASMTTLPEEWLDKVLQL